MTTKTEPVEWPSTWEFVQPGTQMLIGGYVWICDGRVAGTYNLRCPAMNQTKQGRPRYDAKVTVLAPEHPRYWRAALDPALTLTQQVVSGLDDRRQMDLVVGIVAHRLGGAVVAYQDEARRWHVPAHVLADDLLLKAHLLMAHHIDTAPEDDLLVAYHHEAPVAVAHVHDPVGPT